MGVYIKGMEMPFTCMGCELGHIVNCAQWKNHTGEILLDKKTKRHPDCPLVPVPPHGRLIDADELWVEINKICDRRDAGIITDLTCLQQILSALRHAPTIIPAEGKGYILTPQEEYDGLKRKYVVLKSDNGECVENCFVLRPDKDQAAIVALNAYAGATENQVLAADIRKWLSTIIPADDDDG